MIFLKLNSLKSNIFFNPISIPCFSGSRFFTIRVQGSVQVLEVASNMIYLFPITNLLWSCNLKTDLHADNRRLVPTIINIWRKAIGQIKLFSIELVEGNFLIRQTNTSSRYQTVMWDTAFAPHWSALKRFKAVQ